MAGFWFRNPVHGSNNSGGGLAAAVTTVDSIVPVPDVCMPKIRVTARAAIRRPLLVQVPGTMARAACRVGGIGFSAHTGLLIASWVLHRDNHYRKEPGVFKPDRFMPGGGPVASFQFHAVWR